MSRDLDTRSNIRPRLRYLWMVITVRSVVSPKSVVWTMAVIEHWPAVAPFGIVVVNEARPVLEVVRAERWLKDNSKLKGDDLKVAAGLGRQREGAGCGTIGGGTRRQLIIEAVSHVSFALTQRQPFLWILK